MRLIILIAVLASCSSDRSKRSSVLPGPLSREGDVHRPKAAPSGEKKPPAPAPESRWHHIKGCSAKNPKWSQKVDGAFTFTFDYKITRHVLGGKKKRSIVWLTKDGRHRDLFAKVMLTDIGREQILTVRHGMGLKHGDKDKYVHYVPMPPGDYSIKITANPKYLGLLIDGVIVKTYPFKGPFPHGQFNLVWDHGHATEGLGPNEVCVDGTAWSRPIIGE